MNVSDYATPLLLADPPHVVHARSIENDDSLETMRINRVVWQKGGDDFGLTFHSA